MTLARPTRADQDAKLRLENCSYDQDANLHLETPSRSVPALSPARALNHARQSVQTDAPASDTTSPPGRLAVVSSTISRRVFMTTTAAAVISSPSIAATISSHQGPDAELLRRGAELEAA